MKAAGVMIGTLLYEPSESRCLSPVMMTDAACCSAVARKMSSDGSARTIGAMDLMGTTIAFRRIN